MTKINYTFAVDCPVTQLAGKTFTGGKFCRADGGCRGEPDSVLFAEQIGNHRVMARIAGKPELEAALAAYNAGMAAIESRLNAIGWPQYQAAQRRAVNARGAYDAASEHGFPAMQASAMQLADEALEVIAAQYPAAAAYGKTEAYSFAANDLKASAGKRAMLAIEQGADPIQAIAEMSAEWSASAANADANS